MVRIFWQASFIVGCVMPWKSTDWFSVNKDGDTGLRVGSETHQDNKSFSEDPTTSKHILNAILSWSTLSRAVICFLRGQFKRTWLSRAPREMTVTWKDELPPGTTQNSPRGPSASVALGECAQAHNRWPRATGGHSLWRLKDAANDPQRYLTIFLDCSYVTKPKYFGSKIKMISLWFLVCTTPLRVPIPLTSVSFSLEMEKSSMKGGCPEACPSSLPPNLPSSFSFLDLYCLRNPTTLFPHLCIILTLK